MFKEYPCITQRINYCSKSKHNLGNYSDKLFRVETWIPGDKLAWDDATVEKVKLLSIRNDKEFGKREEGRYCRVYVEQQRPLRRSPLRKGGSSITFQGFVLFFCCFAM